MIFRQEIFLFCPIWCRIVLSGVVWCGMAQGGGVHALLRGDGGGGEEEEVVGRLLKRYVELWCKILRNTTHGYVFRCARAIASSANG